MVQRNRGLEAGQSTFSLGVDADDLTVGFMAKR
jgi:hypothetical protein